MDIPFFYHEQLTQKGSAVTLSEEISKHVIQVLRKKQGDQIFLTDGKGSKFLAEIRDDNRKKCVCEITGQEFFAAGDFKQAIGISLLKNTNRFEWFLEKAVELGIRDIFPLICDRTEKQFFREDRMKNIAISAMLQSQQVWLTEIHTPGKVEEIFSVDGYTKKFIAHCMEEEKHPLADLLRGAASSSIVLIGPEGDFTAQEVEQALLKGFRAVSLGSTRLRTETAGLTAAILLTQIN